MTPAASTLYWATAVALLAGALATLIVQRVLCRRRAPTPVHNSSSMASHIEPLLVNGQLQVQHNAVVAAATLAAKSATTRLKTWNIRS